MLLPSSASPGEDSLLLLEGLIGLDLEEEAVEVPWKQLARGQASTQGQFPGSDTGPFERECPLLLEESGKNFGRSAANLSQVLTEKRRM